VREHAGILAVLNDLDAACDLGAYEEWYQRDHLPDRLGVPGFRHARRYRRLEGAGQAFFTFYEVESALVLRSEAYLARLAAPTAGTVAMMRHFRAMCRSVCAVAADAGEGIGGVVAVIGVEAAVPAAGAREVLAGLLGHGAVSRARLWVAAADVEENPEAGLRPGRDARLGAILVVEGTEAGAVRGAAVAAGAALGLPGPVAVYGLLHARDAGA
jgi:hypothetical protein